MELLSSLFFLVVAVGSMFIIAWAIFKIVDFRFDHKENKLKRLYPEYYQKIEERDKLLNADDTYRRKEAVKKIIDNLLIEIVYTPEEELPAKRMEIERLKKEYQKVSAERAAKTKEIKQVQDEIDRIYNSTPKLQKFYKV